MALVPAHQRYLDLWKQHMRPILDRACPVCAALGISPTWGDPVFVASALVEPNFGDTQHFRPAAPPPGMAPRYLVQLTCLESGTVVTFDAAHVGLSAVDFSLGLPSRLPKLAALDQA